MKTWVHYIEWSFAHIIQMFNSPVELVFFSFFFRVPDVQKAKTNSQTLLQSHKISRLKSRTYPQNKRFMTGQFTVDTSLHTNEY